MVGDTLEFFDFVSEVTINHVHVDSMVLLTHTALLSYFFNYS